ncbi:hypothetical protein [Pseudidiomarina insulisalsae]|uniref:Uncharacterized protein n=1 Tax=Pseudidiomarina insulisalsae TaxID=575789 RepID=A0A432YDD2_9GAMM|nr:hypothetical protein [Pseudidiomarina insulisalsae]RUO59010.1 hypothetical protein CWI71_09320 [Pseudidiomarina insulisalsae]
MFKFLWSAGAAVFWSVVIGGLLIWLPIVLFFSGSCGTEEFERVTSPDETKAVVVEIVNCGATTNWQTDIVVIDLNRSDESELLASLDGHPRELSYRIAWQGNERVAVTDFDFEDLLRFKSRHLTGDMVEPLIRPR